MYGNKNHAGFIDGKCKVGGVVKREKRQKKIEKAAVVPVFFSHFALILIYSLHSHAVKFLIKKARKTSLDR